MKAHSGHFDVDVEHGGISIQAAVPGSGHCMARTGRGNIDLQLPSSSSVMLIARTERGTVSVTDDLAAFLVGRVDSTGFLSGALGAATDTVHLETREATSR